jgi:hypothetical protein
MQQVINSSNSSIKHAFLELAFYRWGNFTERLSYLHQSMEQEVADLGFLKFSVVTAESSLSRITQWEID